MKTTDSGKGVPLPESERNPLQISGDLSAGPSCESGAIPFRGENVELFLRLLSRTAPPRGSHLVAGGN